MDAIIKKPKIIIEAVVTRSDGTVENLGEIYNTEKAEAAKEVEENG